MYKTCSIHDYIRSSVVPVRLKYGHDGMQEVIVHRSDLFTKRTTVFGLVETYMSFMVSKEVFKTTKRVDFSMKTIIVPGQKVKKKRLNKNRPG